MYSCPKCKKKMPSIDGKFTRCPHCGNRVLFKDREPVAREVSTD
jgi:DNA-directed RNA polymerase subunit RPC12/RpoP